MKRSIVVQIYGGLVQDVFTKDADEDVLVVTDQPGEFAGKEVFRLIPGEYPSMSSDIVDAIKAFYGAKVDAAAEAPEAHNLIASYADQDDWSKTKQVDVLAAFIDSIGAAGKLAQYLEKNEAEIDDVPDGMQEG